MGLNPALIARRNKLIRLADRFSAYKSHMFHPKSIKVQTRNSTLQLSTHSSKASGHKGIAYLAPSIWNELPSDMKLIPNLNTFKHKLKKWFLENLKKEEQNIYTN